MHDTVVELPTRRENRETWKRIKCSSSASALGSSNLIMLLSTLAWSRESSAESALIVPCMREIASWEFASDPSPSFAPTSTVVLPAMKTPASPVSPVNGSGSMGSMGTGHYVPHDVTTLLQNEGKKAFLQFEKCMTDFENKLRSCTVFARQLGSSASISLSSLRLCRRAMSVLHLFRENATHLYPDGMGNSNRDTGKKRKHHTDRPGRLRHASPSRPASPFDPEDDSILPEELEGFAKDINTFLGCINEFPELADDDLNEAMLNLEGDLKYWSFGFGLYKGQFASAEVKQRIQQLCPELSEHMDTINKRLAVLIETGVPIIQSQQKHTTTNLLNLSTLATFCSAVTATMIQFSYGNTTTALSNGVNGFWFTSLVLSLSAAVNSLLGVKWQQAMYRSPANRVPKWVFFWVKQSPSAFLVCSVASFSMGLVLFVYSTSQHLATSITTTVLAVLATSGIIAVSSWFWREKLHRRAQNSRPEPDEPGSKGEGDDTTQTDTTGPHRFRFLSTTQTAGNWLRKRFEVLHHHLQVVLSSSTDRTDLEAGGILAATGDVPERCDSPAQMSMQANSTHEKNRDHPIIAQPHVAFADAQSGSHEKAQTAAPPALRTTTGAPSVNSGSRRPRFRNVGNLIVLALRFKNMQRTPARIRSRPHSLAHLPSSIDDAQVIQPKASPKQFDQLEHFEFQSVGAVIQQMSFSPDGNYLSTSSLEKGKQPCIHDIRLKSGPFEQLRNHNDRVSDVSWSTDGQYLKVVSSRRIEIRTRDNGPGEQSIPLPVKNTRSATWFPSGAHLLVVEESRDDNGKDIIAKWEWKSKERQSTYQLDEFTLHSNVRAVGISSDETLMFCAADLAVSPSRLKPRKCKVMRELLVYNFAQEAIESRMPVYHDVQHIHLARDAKAEEGQLALVSYRDEAFPQLWKYGKSGANSGSGQQLSLRHTYIPQGVTAFLGSSCFGGKDDEYVICASKGGDIYVWSRDTAAPLHRLKSQHVGHGDITCIAWNRGYDGFMFATGSHDGSVRIWTIPDIEAHHLALTAEPSSSIAAPGASRNKMESGLPERDSSHKQGQPAVVVE